MRSLILGAALTAILSAHAAPPLREPHVGPILRDGDYVFSILPKSFQARPVFDMTVNTEVSNFGRLLRPVSREHPMSYIAVAGGFKQLGDPIYGEKSPPVADLERAMKRSLAAGGYLESESSAATPSLVVIFHWGTHAKPPPEVARNFPELARKYELERAMLVGGKKYFNRYADILEWGLTPFDANDPAQQYLRHQSRDDLYFVVASAYDYAALAHHERKLLWRTSMTVNTTGVNMDETLIPLIATAAPFFGRETADPQIAPRRVSRNGQVEIGETKVIEDSLSPQPTGPK